MALSGKGHISSHTMQEIPSGSTGRNPIAERRFAPRGATRQASFSGSPQIGIGLGFPVGPLKAKGPGVGKPIRGPEVTGNAREDATEIWLDVATRLPLKIRHRDRKGEIFDQVAILIDVEPQQ